MGIGGYIIGIVNVGFLYLFISYGVGWFYVLWVLMVTLMGLRTIVLFCLSNLIVFLSMSIDVYFCWDYVVVFNVICCAFDFFLYWFSLFHHGWANQCLVRILLLVFRNHKTL